MLLQSCCYNAHIHIDAADDDPDDDDVVVVVVVDDDDVDTVAAPDTVAERRH